MNVHTWYSASPVRMIIKVKLFLSSKPLALDIPLLAAGVLFGSDVEDIWWWGGGREKAWTLGLICPVHLCGSLVHLLGSLPLTPTFRTVPL